MTIPLKVNRVAGDAFEFAEFTTGDIIPVEHGGLGLADIFVTGDLVYAGGADSFLALGIGAAGTVLRSNGATPAWSVLAKGDLPASIAYEDEANIFTAALTSERTLSTEDTLNTRLASDPAAVYRMAIKASGAIEWGSGSAARDTNLYRTSADRLKTDDSFEVVGNLIFSGDNTSVVGGIGRSAANGLQLRATAGGTYDFVLLGSSSGITLANTPGTNDLETGGHLTVSGRVRLLTNQTGLAGSIYKSSANGLASQGVAGSVYDWSVIGAAGGIVLGIPTGTTNLTMPGTSGLTVGGTLNVTGVASFASTGTATFGGSIAAAQNFRVTNSGGSGLQVAAGDVSSFMDLDFPDHVTAAAQIRLLRDTNTSSGTVSFIVYRGDGTGTELFKVHRTTGTSVSTALAVTGISTFSQLVNISRAAGTNRQVEGQTSGSARWRLVLGDSTAEAGADSGSDFALTRFTDAGVGATVLSAVRSTGAAAFSAGLTVTGVLTASSGITSSSASGSQVVSGGNAVGNGGHIEFYGGSHATLANNIYYDADVHTFRAQAGGAIRAAINSTGLGIGITPVTALHVIGVMRVAESGIRSWDIDVTGAGAFTITDAGSATVALSMVNPTGAATFASTVQGTGFLVSGNQVVGARKTGWALATGTATRTAFDTATVTLSQLAERTKALIDDLYSTAGHGLIGA